MVSVSRKLYVLLWKCLLLRKKNWLLTIFELICPIIVTLAIYGFNLIGQEDAYIIKKPKELFSLDNTTVRLKYLAYNPSNTFTNVVIKSVRNSGNLPKVEYFEPLKNELELDEWLQNKTLLDRQSEAIGITFKYINNITKEFKYVIRTNSHKMLTEKIKDALITPFQVYQIDSSFLVVQIALDSELLKCSGFNLKEKHIFVGELPTQKPPYEIAIYVMYSFIMIAYVFLVASVSREVLQEKYTGIKELMKILGVSSWMIWTQWLMYTLMVQFPVTIFMATILTVIEPTVIQANAFIVWLLFFLFTLDCIFLCFSCSCLFNRPMRGTSMCVIIWFVLNMSTMGFIKNPGDYELFVQILMCLIPLHNLCWALTTIHSFGKYGIKWSFGHVFTNGYTGSQISIGLSICIFFLEIIFWVLLFIILDVVKPGPYGIAKPFSFVYRCCEKLRLQKRQIDDDTYEFRTSLPTRFEHPPQGAKVGIKIRRLHKEFGWFHKVVAVENVDLDIYEGEIMALLGHNGAGKTTMMSLITGMFSPTHGVILVEDKDINTELSHIRQTLGFCTQHNMYFPKLTVIEHLLFFGMLKGMSYSRAKECGVEILNILNIIEKQDSEVYKLSGGMRRKLCLGVSLIGNPKVLILDEPTSGLDPENRRQIWNIILKMRGSRTVLLTTHFMEEADALGDRIAIMDQGQVVCCGTTMFLKKIYGTGYTIHILIKAQSIIDDIYAEIKKQIPKVQLKIISLTQVDFVIKEDLVDKFPYLFQILEKQQEGLGIISMSVTCTTLEDVFLQVAEKFAEGDWVEDEDRGHFESITSRLSIRGHEKVAGLLLFFQICQVLIWKRFIYFYRSCLSSLLTTICSIALVFLVVWLSKLDTSKVGQQHPLTISLNIYPGSTILLKNDENNSKIANNADKLIKHQGGNVKIVPHSSTLTTLALELDRKDFSKYISQILLALDFTKEEFTFLYQPKLNIHTPAIAINLMSNILLQGHSITTGSITVTNHPYVLPQDEKCRKSDIFRVVPQFCWLFFVSCALIVSMMNFIPFLTEERSSGFKHQQTIAGAPTLLYWISNFVLDYFFCFCTVIIFILIISVHDRNIVPSDSHLESLINQVLIFYSISGLFFVYFFTFLFDNSVTCNTMFLIYNLAFALFPAFVIYLDIIQNYTVFLTLIVLLSFNPNFAATISMGHIGKAVLDEQFCTICGETYCTNKTDLLMNMPTIENRTGISLYILYLALSWILYLIIIIVIEFNSGRKISSIFQNRKETTSSRNSTFEEDVQKESHQVTAVKESGNTSNPLRVEGLVKKYVCGPKAVNQVTFLVNKGECFGLLGVNGAGKTTTFKILTGDILPNSGDAFVAKYSVIRNRKKYLSCIGYCPQFDALLDRLTGEETLEVIAKIRGIPHKNIKEEVDFLLSVLGIGEHAKKHTITYSGGTKRKLSTAMAFIGNPEVVFLDEPTTGVDPVSRRQLWGVVQARLSAGQAVVLTSHSMEECEALCSRLTIMRNGQMQCIGTLEYLKKKYGKGYTVLIKLLHSNDRELDDLKIEFQRVFPESLIKDEHVTLIHYQILNPSTPLSKLFTDMLRMQRHFDIIEDFNVSNTTLEQLFLTFARKEETVERCSKRLSLH